MLVNVERTNAGNERTDAKVGNPAQQIPCAQQFVTAMEQPFFLNTQIFKYSDI